MLAKRVANIPQDGGWIFEPKWDGFRAVIFRDGDEFLIQSRDGKSLNRYFPELIDPLKRELARTLHSGRGNRDSRRQRRWISTAFNFAFIQQHRG